MIIMNHSICNDPTCLCNSPPPTLSDAERIRIVRNPQAWLTEQLRLLKQKERFEYFLTFTKIEEVPREKFVARIKFEMSRTFVKSFMLAFEHIETNLHAHAKIVSTKYLDNQTFQTYTKHIGFLKWNCVNTDNGIKEYLEKENNIITDVDSIKID